MHRVVIVDDEEQAIKDLAGLIKLYCPGLELVATATSSDEAMEVIYREQPEIVFLDIQIDAKSGIELLQEMDQVNFEVVFVTAHQHYAIDALRLSAVDYLLKPVEVDLLLNSVSRVSEKLKQSNLKSNLDTLIHNLSDTNICKKKLVLSTMEMVHLVELNDIVWCKSETNYTKFKVVEQGNIIISKTLKEYAEQLSSFGFLRIHRSYLINLKHLVGFDKREGGSVVMSDGEKLPVAIRKRDEFMKIFEQWK
ncbi:MAG: LytTR family DNA-binding domain-containing protein [Bacteroidota bacterium]